MGKTPPKNQLWHKGLIAPLEQRLMYDGAMGDAAAEITAPVSPDSEVTPTDNTLLAALDITPGSGRGVAVIDTGVEDHEILSQAARDAGLDVILISGSENSLETLAQTLSNMGTIDSLHILSHGSQGEFRLGNALLSQETLNQYSQSLAAIGSALASDGDILLYGCEVGQTQEGMDFIEELAIKTDADIAASDDLTGTNNLGGDWELEVHVGNIETEPAFDAKSTKDFFHVLTSQTIDFNAYSIANSGAYNGAASSNAEFTYGSTTLIIDGTDVSTYAVNDMVLAGGGKNTPTESEVIIRFADGATFDVTAITVQNYSYNYETFVFTTDTPQSYTTGSIYGYGSTTPSLNFTGITELRISTSDSTMSALIDDLVIDNVVSNNAPTIAGTPMDITINEDTLSNVDLSGVTVADVDGDNLTLTLSADVGSFATPADGSGVGSGVTATLLNATNLRLSGSAADINTYLDTTSNIRYQGPLDVHGAKAANITVSVTDGSANLISNPNIEININAVNDAPTISGLPTSVTMTEDTLSNLDLSALTLADVDSTDPDFNLSITAGSGTLTATSDPNITISGSGTGTLSLVGSVANINTYLNTSSNIQYTGAANVQGTNADTLTLTGDDQDGSGNVSLGTVQVDITNVNDAPQIAGLPLTVTANEDVASNVDLSSLTIGDMDSTGSNFTLLIGAGSGTLTAVSGGGVTVTGSGGSSLTLTGTVTDIDSFLNTASNIQYTGTLNLNGSGVDSLSLVANDQDGSGQVNLGSVQVDITAVNDAPSLSNIPTSITVTEDQTGNLDLSAMTLSDVDSTGSNFTLTIAAGSGTLVASSSGGVTVSGS
ncbi:MAG: DUF4347 domain-containing protein, partial [Desulfobacterales bacterium]|nr:DUF4347 domain-containing protein [Desulfobacterales bacterium]